MRRLIEIAALAALPMSAMEAQVRVHPFSEDELYRAFRFRHGEGEARAMAREAISGEEPSPIALPADAYAIVGVEFAEETLIVLSLLSPETEAKVEEYRRRGSRSISGEEQLRWQRRREELRTQMGREPPN
jgi:hypothetical protein